MAHPVRYVQNLPAFQCFCSRRQDPFPVRFIDGAQCIVFHHLIVLFPGVAGDFHHAVGIVDRDKTALSYLIACNPSGNGVYKVF